MEEFKEIIEKASKTLSRDVEVVKNGGAKTRLYTDFENFVKTNKYVLENNPYSYEYVVGKA